MAATTNALGLLRLMPDFKGKLRIANFFIGHKRKDIKDILVPLRNGTILQLPNLVENSCWEISCNGAYEKQTIDFLNSQLPPNSVLIDIGANIGAISVSIAAIRKDVKIIAVEASPRIFDYLTENIARNNLTNITVLNKAIHKETGLKLQFYSPENKIGCGSFAPVFTNEAVEVETISLDDLIKSCNVDFNAIGIVKVDIEGHEILAFQGADEYHNSKSPKFYFEFVDWAEKAAGFSSGASQALLLSKGYKLAVIEGKVVKPQKDIQITGSNMLFAKKFR